jgi:hypothetical protein
VRGAQSHISISLTSRSLQAHPSQPRAKRTIALGKISAVVNLCPTGRRDGLSYDEAHDCPDCCQNRLHCCSEQRRTERCVGRREGGHSNRANREISGVGRVSLVNCAIYAVSLARRAKHRGPTRSQKRKFSLWKLDGRRYRGTQVAAFFSAVICNNGIGE